MILILSWFLITKGKLKEAQSKQITLIWLFIILLAVYIPFAHNNFFAYQATKDMILFMPFILSTIVCVNSIDRLKKLIFISICLMMYVSLYSITHGGKGSGNYFHDENDTALFINIWVPICYFMLFTEKRWKVKIVYIAGLVLGIIVVIVSFSRGGFLGLVSVALIAWLFSKRKMVSFMILCILGFVFYLYASNISSDPSRKGGVSYWAEIATTTETDQGTAHGRILSWQAGWEMFLHNPWGVGGGNFSVKFPDYQPEEFKKNMWGRASHSLWFTLIPELGIAGIIIYFSLLYYNLSDLFYLKKIKVNKNADIQYINYLSRALIASFTGYFVSGTFLSVLYYPHYWYVTGILVAMAKISKKLMLENFPAQGKLSQLAASDRR
jgi:hypothetical protein